MLFRGHSGFGKLRVTDVFLLGAGFSRAISPQMPTLAELSRLVLTRLGDRITQRLPKPAHENIELALAFLSARQPWLSEGEYHRRLGEAYDVAAAIGEVLAEAEWQAVKALGASPEWLLKLVFWMHDDQAAIITFNYDTLLERTFAQIPITECVGLPAVHLDPQLLQPMRFSSDSKLPFAQHWPTAGLLKLHGSGNWPRGINFKLDACEAPRADAISGGSR